MTILPKSIRRLRQAARWKRYVWGYRLRRFAKSLFYRPAAGLVSAVFWLFKRMGPDRASDFGGRLARRVGPWLGASRRGMKNLRAAYPEKSEEELRGILAEVWENLGRTAAEYPHLQEIWDYEYEGPTGRVEAVGIENFVKLREDGLPAIVFTAHLGNWELPAVCAARHGLPVSAVYRIPNNPHVARMIEKVRSQTMGNMLAAGSGQAVAMGMSSALSRGDHLGILVDQRLRRGVGAPFFGRIARTNPILGHLARRFDCPVHGVRVIRLPGNRFRLELTDQIELPRDAEGYVDVEKTMVKINAIVEGWVREHPGQWLWLHNRW